MLNNIIFSITFLMVSVATAASAVERVDFEKGFINLNSSERKNIQIELKGFGDTYDFAVGYQSNIDGKWGPSTEAALQEAYRYISRNYNGSQPLTSSVLLALILKPNEFWLIGSDFVESCNGCNSEGNYRQGSTILNAEEVEAQAHIENVNLPEYVQWVLIPGYDGFPDSMVPQFDMTKFCKTQPKINNKYENNSSLRSVTSNMAWSV